MHYLKPNIYVDQQTCITETEFFVSSCYSFDHLIHKLTELVLTYLTLSGQQLLKIGLDTVAVDFSQGNFMISRTKLPITKI